MITTFIFDIGNVLLNFNYLEQYRSLYDEQTAQALADATVRNTPLWAELDRGTLSYEEAIALLQKNAPHLYHQIPHAIHTMYERLESYSYSDRWLQSLKEKGYRVSNVDATILAQKPKLKPHIPQMIENLARALRVEPSRINVKATTEERLGFTGREEGMSCHAVCLLEEREDQSYV